MVIYRKKTSVDKCFHCNFLFFHIFFLSGSPFHVPQAFLYLATIAEDGYELLIFLTLPPEACMCHHAYFYVVHARSAVYQMSYIRGLLLQ